MSVPRQSGLNVAPSSLKCDTRSISPDDVVSKSVSLFCRRHDQKTLSLVFTRATLDSAGISCRVSVRLSQVGVLLKRLKRRITQTTPHDIPGTLVFSCRKISAKLKRGHPQRRCQMHVRQVKCRCSSWKLTTFDTKRCQLTSSSVVSLLH